MNMKKYAVTAAVAAVLSGTFAGAVPAFAAGVSATIAAKQTAVTNAQKVVPAAAKLVSAKTDDNEFELEFLDPDTLERYEVEVDGETVHLTKKEYSLLEYMMRNKRTVLTRDQILEKVWGYDYSGDTNVVDVYIRYLRAKLDDRFHEKYIYTVRGVGYAVKE